MVDLVLHIGYPKTATTTLQRHLFPLHSGLRYLGKSVPEYAFDTAELGRELAQLVSVDDTLYGGTDQLRRLIERYRNGSDLPLLLSSEAFLHPAATDRGLVALRARESFFPCRILIVIRDQLDLIRSFFGLHGRFGQHLFLQKPPYERFSLPLAMTRWLELMSRAPSRNLLSLLHYDRVVARYCELFGKENVRVLLFEEFATNRARFIADLCDWLAIDAGEASRLLQGRHELPNLSRLERMLVPLRSWIPGDHERSEIRLIPTRWAGKVAPQRLPGAWMTRIASMYSDGNGWLARELGLPLSDYGYPMPRRML